MSMRVISVLSDFAGNVQIPGGIQLLILVTNSLQQLVSAINPLRLYVSQGKDHRVVRHPRHLVSTLTVSFDRRNLNHLFGGQDTLSCVICSFQHVAYYLS